MKQIVIGDIPIQVEKKNIKNMYIRILPPDGLVKITAPRSIADDTVRMFAVSRIDWIKKNKARLQNQPSKTERQYVSGEIHYLWGRRYILEVAYSNTRNAVSIKADRIVLQVCEGSTAQQRKCIMEEWYRGQIKEAIPAALARCERVVGKYPDEWRVKSMKTRWGTCNVNKKRIWLNLQLAKKVPECLDYVIVHELVHLYVRNHNKEFKSYMDKFYPNWRAVKKLLNEQGLE